MAALPTGLRSPYPSIPRIVVVSRAFKSLRSFYSFSFNFRVDSSRMRKRDTRQATFLFDGEEPRPSMPFRDVPQAVFLAWSERMQNDYCAARDLDSARTAEERGEDADWYRERANGYSSHAL